MKALSGRDIAGIVARNAVPVAGMVFLGWKAATLVILYYLDTLVSLAAAAWAREPELRQNMGVFVLVFGGIFGGWAFFVTYGQVEFGWPLVAGALVQVIAAFEAFAPVPLPASARARSRRDDALWGHIFFVMGRWVAAVMLGLLWAPAIVVIYAAVTVFYEVAWRDRAREE